MRFFVLQRDAATGGISVPVTDTFAVRDDALAAIGTAMAEGAIAPDAEVYIADLDQAVPVLVLPQPAAVPPAEIPSPEVVPAQETSIEPVDEITVDVPVEAMPGPEVVEQDLASPPLEPALAVATEDDDDVTALAEATDLSLAEALKRAASSLESEGIVAPESVPAPEPIEGLPVVESAPLEAAEAGEQAPSAAGAEWPWANVEAYEPAAPVAGETAAAESAASKDTVEPTDVAATASVSTELEALVSALADDQEAVMDADTAAESLITGAPPAGEDAFLPRPVILGDYEDMPPAEVIPTPAVHDEVVSEPTVAPEESAPFEVAPAQPDEAPISEQPGYEAEGELDLSAYTCEDCVYTNTCPKVGTVAPADCGAFQWRSS